MLICYNTHVNSLRTDRKLWLQELHMPKNRPPFPLKNVYVYNLCYLAAM